MLYTMSEEITVCGLKLAPPTIPPPVRLTSQQVSELPRWGGGVQWAFQNDKSAHYKPKVTTSRGRGQVGGGGEPLVWESPKTQKAKKSGLLCCRGGTLRVSSPSQTRIGPTHPRPQALTPGLVPKKQRLFSSKNTGINFLLQLIYIWHINVLHPHLASTADLWGFVRSRISSCNCKTAKSAIHGPATHNPNSASSTMALCPEVANGLGEGSGLGGASRCSGGSTPSGSGVAMGLPGLPSSVMTMGASSGAVGRRVPAGTGGAADQALRDSNREKTEIG